LTLIVYDRWRRDGWKPGAAVAPLCLFASVMSAEAGIAICAYLFAYEVTLGRGRWRQRFAALLPSVVIVLVWRVLYNRLGYGAAGGGFYFDPVREPIGYALVVLKRAPFLLGGQWTTLPPEMHSFLPFGSTMVAWAFMMLAAVATPVVMWPYLKSHARARFWLLGMYLSALPFCATIPMGRSLAFVAIGGFGLIAEFVGSANRRASWMPTQRWRVLPLLWMAPLFVVAHGPLAALGRVGAPSVTNQMVAEMAEVMQISDEGDLARQDLIVVNAPNPSAFLYEPYLRAEQGRPVPRHVRLLAPGYGEVEVTRTGPQQVTVRSVADSLFDCQRPGRPDFVYFYRYLSDVRGSAHPLEASRRITLDGMVAQVRAVDGQGQAVEVTFDFDVPLDDASLQWLWWDWDHDLYKPFDVPPLGQSRRLVGPF
jgi:branched-subunit amino acid transport protein